MIHIRIRHLRAAGLVCLLLPTTAFLLTWVRPAIAIPSAVMLCAAVLLFIRRDAASPEEDAFGTEAELSISLPSLLTAVIAAIVWTFFSGIGGTFFQTHDHHGRNAIFHDMLENPWPVYFEGTDYALTYYLAYWILPALFAKGVAFFLGSDALWPAGNAALFIQTVVLLIIIFLLLLPLVRARSLPAVLVALLIFIFFSGMDGLPVAIKDNWTQQYEWWAQSYQFSSNTTCLFWVYNQALPAWLATLLLMSRPHDLGWYALLGLSVFPFSPLPFVGLFFVMLCLFSLRFAAALRSGQPLPQVRALLLSCLSADNLLACAAIIPSFFFYFLSNQATRDGGFALMLFFDKWGMLGAVSRLALFWLIEFGILALFIAPCWQSAPLFVIAVLSLLLAPLFRLGYNADFAMRASIPGLIILCVYAARTLIDRAALSVRRYEVCLLVLLLALGSITPVQEFKTGINMVRQAGTNFMFADSFKTVLHPDAHTFNFICDDVNSSVFYRYFARKGAAR
ncbi:MAG: hypothetical protein J6K32_03905 [Clostridia bacterium]|nr:hypothetical protein [Clostridia bacterium]